MDNTLNKDTFPQKVRTDALDPFFSNVLVSPNPVKLVDVVIAESVKLGASDVFFEPQPNELLVRIRIDGVLHELGSVNPNLYDQVVSRIKIMASLDPTERRKVQEGQININLEGKNTNLRIEIVQTINGELVVVRIHEKKTILMPLTELGFNKIAYDTFTKMLESRTGLILVCGPTGCGKTTTLYSTLTKLSENRNFNIMTIEDPVEFQLESVNQMQVQKDTGFTFAQGLKTILRLSPDVVLVGEIRDKETAEIAIESGLTGQLVLSTIHSQDAVGGLYRILDLGIETYFLNSSLSGIVAQRLVRRICPACSTPYKPSQDELDLFHKLMAREPKQLVKGNGCAQCGYLGFKGRVGIFEVLNLTSKIRTLLREKVNESEIRESLFKDDFITLPRDGLEKAEQGITTISEVFRNSIRIY